MMNYAREQAGAVPPAVEARLQCQAREAACVVGEIGKRLERLLDRLRSGPVEGNDISRNAGSSVTLDGAVCEIRDHASRAHELLNEIESFV